MRRLLLVLSVAALMAAVMVASALPVLAAPANKPGQYTCFDVLTGTADRNVPQGKTDQPQYYDPFWGTSTCYRNN